MIGYLLCWDILFDLEGDCFMIVNAIVWGIDDIFCLLKTF